jgi:nucleoside-diphosphate-sugar epimerase
MSELSSPTGREEELRAVPRGRHGAACARARCDRLHRGTAGAAADRGRLPRARARARCGRPAAFSWGDEVDVVVGSAVDEPALAQACADVDVLYYLIHSMSAGAGFEQADLAAARAVATAAAAASVARLVYLGGLHPEGVPLSPHLRSRVEVGRCSSPAVCPRSCCRPVS